MFGLLRIEEKKAGLRRGVTGGLCTLYGGRFFEVRVCRSRSRFLTERRLCRAARCMEQAGVRRALFPENFGGMPFFEACGIRAAGDSFLKQRMAPELTLWCMEQQGLSPFDCTAALLGEIPALKRVLPKIALRLRRTLLAARGGEALCAELWREYGVSVRQAPSAAELGAADVVLTFGTAEPIGREGCLWLPFGAVQQAEGFENGLAQVEYRWPSRLGEGPEIDCKPGALLSALLEMGILRENDAEAVEIRQNA